jgi:hypothetical protein
LGADVEKLREPFRDWMARVRVCCMVGRSVPQDCYALGSGEGRAEEANWRGEGRAEVEGVAFSFVACPRPLAHTVTVLERLRRWSGRRYGSIGYGHDMCLEPGRQAAQRTMQVPPSNTERSRSHGRVPGSGDERRRGTTHHRHFLVFVRLNEAVAPLTRQLTRGPLDTDVDEYVPCLKRLIQAGASRDSCEV